MKSLQLTGSIEERNGRSRRRTSRAWIAAILTCSSLAGVTSVSAGPVACVQRVIDWTNASPFNGVEYSVVAIHESGEAAYASGRLTGAQCPRQLWAGTVSCLKTDTRWPGAALPAVLLHPSIFPVGRNQNYDFLPLSFDSIPGENEQEVHMRQPNATYDFYPRCAGNLLVGDDQWGNRWTVAFTLE